MRFYNSWDNGSKFLDVLFEWQALVAESKREPVQTELAPPVGTTSVSSAPNTNSFSRCAQWAIDGQRDIYIFRSVVRLAVLAN